MSPSGTFRSLNDFFLRFHPNRAKHPVALVFRHALHECAVLPVDGDAAVARDVAEDGIRFFRLAAFGQFDHQVVHAFDQHTRR